MKKHNLNKPKLNANKILNKRFSTKIGGYDPSEVDKYLDVIRLDYLYYEKQIYGDNANINFQGQVVKDLEQKVQILEEEIKNKNAIINSVESKTLNSSAMIKRITDLENQIKIKAKNINVKQKSKNV